MNASPPPLAGQRVLLVEDRFHVAEEMRRIVQSLGGTVVGPVATAGGALALIARGAPDLALLDIDLDDHSVYPVAAALVALQAPFVFATGFEQWMVDARFRDVPIVAKPMTTRGLLAAIRALQPAHAA